LRGEIGFLITQLEIAIKFVENVNGMKLDIENFKDKVLYNEVRLGIHT